jgi:hypothetical protein
MIKIYKHNLNYLSLLLLLSKNKINLQNYVENKINVRVEVVLV